MINDTHPYTNRPNRDYLTVVLEKIESGSVVESTSPLFDSMRDGSECTLIPGYRVTAVSIGDELSNQEAAECDDEEG